MEVEYIFYGILALIVIGRFLLQVRDTVSGPVLTGSATVVSKRVTEADYRTRSRNAKTWYVNSGWNYLVTFRLSDGELLELYTFENDYHRLEAGMMGQLTWHKDSMSRFDADKEVTV